MAPRYKCRGIRGKWTEDNMQTALAAVKHGVMKIYTASKQFSIPRRTLKRYLVENKIKKSSLGRKPLLNREQENDLKSRIIRLCSVGYPFTSRVLRSCGKTFCDLNNIAVSSKGVMIGRDWLRGFLKRHTDLSRRKAQNLNPARAQKLNKTVVADYFKKLKKVLEENDLLNSPERIYNISCSQKRPDLMIVRDGKLCNKGTDKVCWNGQLGGLEGLRQKGWSVLNLLVIKREGLKRNTQLKILAQGDNQVICTKYKIQSTRNQEEICEKISKIIQNNNAIMNAIEVGIGKIGLQINKDETLQSADFMTYGKTPIFRGNIRCLETKKWSRVTCVTNDQLPTLANIMSSVTSNALAISHSSDSPINTIVHFNYVGNLVRNIIEFHNPAIKDKVRRQIKQSHLLNSTGYKVATLYLDPSLGGVCGSSLTRFLISGFPDPITESLSFLKTVHDHIRPDIQNLLIQMGNPLLTPPSSKNISKLLESPLSLNISRGVSAVSLLKNLIKKFMLYQDYRLENEIIREAVLYSREEEERLHNFLGSIKPYVLPIT